MAVLSLWKPTELPGGRAWPAGLVLEALHGLLPRDDLSLLHERMLPVPIVLVPAAIDKGRVSAIGDFELVDEVLAERDCLGCLVVRQQQGLKSIARRYGRHVDRDAAFLREQERLGYGPRRSRHLHCHEAGLANVELVDAQWKPQEPAVRLAKASA